MSVVKLAGDGRCSVVGESGKAAHEAIGQSKSIALMAAMADERREKEKEKEK